MAKIHSVMLVRESDDLDKRHPGRFRAVHRGGITKYGIIVASVYGYTGKDAEAPNADLLNLVARQLATAKMPFALGGKWNLSPQALAATGFPLRLKASSRRPGNTLTCPAGPIPSSTTSWFGVPKSGLGGGQGVARHGVPSTHRWRSCLLARLAAPRC